MKKLLITTLLLILTIATNAQKDVTKFLGIPIDGTKAAMIEKLKAKGFTPTTNNPEVLEGEFNGTDVEVYIVTNNRKVWRIMLADKNRRGETDIRIRFNNLCRQFRKNYKYIKQSSRDYILSDEEDISYEMSVHNKRYEAPYYQMADATDSTYFYAQAKASLKWRYTLEELNNPTKEIKEDIDKAYNDAWWEHISKKSVWFMISELGGTFYICMYYDNEYNRADGEDL